MNQPELGKKVARLRQKLNMTQEQLAEICGINSRSLQRIEAGESMPRSHTVQKLNKIFNVSIMDEGDDTEDIWLALMHLSSVFPVVIIALIIWVWKRPTDSRIAHQGVDVINFQISMWLYMMIASSLIIYIVGLIILPFIGIFICVISIKNTIKAVQGIPYHYPLSIHLVKHT